MWDRKQILAEIRAYTSSCEEIDSNSADIVQAFITRSLIRDRKYQSSLFTSKENKDPEQSQTNGPLDSGDCCDQEENELAQILSNIDLNEDNSCNLAEVDGINTEEDHIEEIAESLDVNTFIGEDTFCSTELMESMGLPVAFGSKRGKSRKEQKLTEKQIRNKFLDSWAEHGELMVYKSFVTIYPDYVGIYDQITGSIPPCEEVEITCVDNEGSGDCISVEKVKDETSNMPNEGGDAFLGGTSSSSINSSNNLAEVGSGGDVCTLASNESAGVDSVMIPNGCSTTQSSQNHLYSVNSEHSYGSKEGDKIMTSDQEETNNYENEYFEGDGSENNYTHEELIAILRGTHQDLENQIYWHAKETISEWYRKHPNVDFDISSLDADIMDITYPYLNHEEEGEGEVVDGYHLDDNDEEYEEYYDAYAEEKDEDLIEEDGSTKDVSLTDTLEICGLAVQKDVSISNQRKRKIIHGTVTYKRKNIYKEAKRLHLHLDVKSKHIVFNDDGEPIESEDNEIQDELPVTQQLKSGQTGFSENVKDGADKMPTSDSDSGPEEVPINHTSETITKSKSLTNISTVLEDFGPVTSAKSCEDSLETFTGENKNAIERQKVKEENGTRVIAKSKKKKKNKLKRKKCDENSDEVHPAKSDPQTCKYWYQRYLLFSRFDHGIQMDAESWYSVTPEAIAAHQAKRCQGRYVLDGFCGAGGNVIQFAMFGCKVVAIDIDEEKIKMAKHNAGVYGVEDKIEFIIGDFMEIAPQYAGIVDMVFLSPPWGGPDYIRQDVYDAENMNATKLLEVSRRVTENIALFMPKNSCATQIITLAGESKSVEIEQNFVDSRVKAITAYFGDLVMTGGDS